MRRFVIAVLVAVLPCCLGSLVRKAAAASGDEPCCWRGKVGSSDVHLAVSWYVGVVKAVEDRDVEVGLRLTLYRHPRGAEPAEAKALTGGGTVAGGLLSRVNEVVGTLAGYGVIGPDAGLDRFVRSHDRAWAAAAATRGVSLPALP